MGATATPISYEMILKENVNKKRVQCDDSTKG